MRKIVLYVVYVLIIACLGAWLIWSFGIHHDSKKPQATKPGNAHSQQTQTDTNPSSSSDSSSDNATDGQTSSTATDVPSQSSAAANSSATSSSQLSNTGPGDVLALFVVSSVVAGVGFNRYQALRLRAGGPFKG